MRFPVTEDTYRYTSTVCSQIPKGRAVELTRFDPEPVLMHLRATWALSNTHFEADDATKQESVYTLKYQHEIYTGPVRNGIRHFGYRSLPLCRRGRAPA